MIRTKQKYFPNYAPSIVFDVGANVGQSAVVFARAFPKALIYCFEPVPATFKTLQRRTKALSQVRIFDLALGAQCSTAIMIQRGTSAKNRIVTTDSDIIEDGFGCVTVEAGDNFCRKHDIKKISYLKIDAEGYDNEVLAGFKPMLVEQDIDFIEVEVSMNVSNTLHVPFGETKLALEKTGYHLFHIYGQAMEFLFGGLPIMRRCNAVFVSHSFAEANRRQLPR
jgi:FkbM family methyltransferase